MEPFLLFIVAFFIALAVQLWIAIWWLGLRYFRPMRRLANTIELFAQGNWNQRATLKRNDELGKLANMFNYAAGRLQETYIAEERQVETASGLARLAASAPGLDEYLEQSQALLAKQYEHLLLTISPAWLPEQPVGAKQPADARSDGEGLPAAPDASLPVMMHGQSLATLNVVSATHGGPSNADLSELRAVAEQLAPALQIFRLHEAQAALETSGRLREAGRQIARAETAEQVFQSMNRAFDSGPCPALLLQYKADGLLLVAGPSGGPELSQPLPAWLDQAPAELESRLTSETAYLLAPQPGGPALPLALSELLARLGCASAAWLPTWREDRPALLLVLGAAASDPRRAFTPYTLQPYIHLVELATTALEKIQARQALRQLQEDSQRQAERERTLDEIGGQIRSSVDLQGILQNTATALGSALDARRATIRIQLEGTDPSDEP